MRIRMHLLCSRRFILRRSRRLTVLSTLSTDSRQLARHTKTTPPPLISIMSALKENMMAAVAANGTQKVVNSSCASSLRSQTDAEAVREFTGGAGQPIPNQPCVMDKTEVDFISKMILDETMELLATVYEPAEAKAKLVEFISKSKDIPKEVYNADTEHANNIAKAADQADALNAACKKGWNLSSLFHIVHDANMRKRVDGKFLKRADGKIIKPKGWVGPDVPAEIQRQFDEGSFEPLK